jgi:hypothetical protein
MSSTTAPNVVAVSVFLALRSLGIVAADAGLGWRVGKRLRVEVAAAKSP